MPFRRDGIDAHVNEHIDRQFRDPFALFNPLFYFLGLTRPDQMNRVRRPSTAAVFGGNRMGTAEIKNKLGSTSHHFRYVKNEPNDGEAVEFGGETPVASGFAEDNFGTAETRWTHIMEPVRLRKHSLEFANGEEAVGAIVDESIAPVWERFVKRINQGWWTDTMSLADQNKTVWGKWQGLKHTLTNDNYYGIVNRAVETNLNGLEIDASTDFAETRVGLNMIRKINNGFQKFTSGDTVTGLAGRTQDGRGAYCWMTTPQLWQELADETDTRYYIIHDGIPDTGLAGFKRPIINYDGNYITWDPFCPDGEMYGLCMQEWCLEISPQHNFTWSGLKDKSELEEGGDYYLWGHFDLLARLTCRAPWLQARVKNLTTS